MKIIPQTEELPVIEGWACSSCASISIHNLPTPIHCMQIKQIRYPSILHVHAKIVISIF